MFTFLISFDEALMTGMLNGDYILVTNYYDLFDQEILVLRHK